jgi:hypothetical protein
MRTGRCLCGSVTYELGDVLATAVCHCSHCQRQSGAAFSVNLVAHESQLTVRGELKTYEERGDAGGDTVFVRRRFCPECGSPIVSELALSGGIVAVKAGTLDDTSDVQPGLEAWCVDRQPWVSLPGIATSLDRE